MLITGYLHQLAVFSEKLHYALSYDYNHEEVIYFFNLLRLDLFVFPVLSPCLRPPIKEAKVLSISEVNSQ